MIATRDNGIINLTFNGPVSDHNPEHYRELVSLMYEVAMIKGHNELFVIADLGQVSFINSTGLGQLIILHTCTRTRGGRFAICNVPKRVQALLDLTNTRRVFEEFGNQDQAKQAFLEGKKLL